MYPDSCIIKISRILNLHAWGDATSTRGDLRRIITVTLSIFNFSTGFLAQIVENREERLERLSRPFLGSEDKFPPEKS